VEIGVAILEEKRLPASRADSFADFDVDNQPAALGCSDLIMPKGIASFFLFNAIQPPSLIRTASPLVYPL
jgi:hypothetical protein